MHPELRARFNSDFSPEKYSGLLRCVNETEKWPADFRISETPIFLTREFCNEVVGAANEIVAKTRSLEFARHAASAIPPGLEVPNEAPHPNFLVVDFGICVEGGRLTPRLIELQAFPSLFGFPEEINVVWVGHPNWYFRISKHSLPFLKTAHTARAFFADEFPAAEPTGDFVLKPLYSFAGLGVDMEPTREKLAALTNPQEWILQQKVHYAEFVPTPKGPKSKAEIRMMFVWPDNEPDPILVNNLVRMSQGKMMGVDFNKDKTWVGSSIALHERGS